MATKELLNVRDTARLFGVHENTIRNWQSSGVLRAVHLPGSGYRRFLAADVERLRAEMFEQLGVMSIAVPNSSGPLRKRRPAAEVCSSSSTNSSSAGDGYARGTSRKKSPWLKSSTRSRS